MDGRKKFALAGLWYNMDIEAADTHRYWIWPVQNKRGQWHSETGCCRPQPERRGWINRKQDGFATACSGRDKQGRVSYKPNERTGEAPGRQAVNLHT